MNNDLNITEEEYKQINAVDEDDSIKVNRENIRKVRKKIIILIQKSVVFLNTIFETDKNTNKKKQKHSALPLLRNKGEYEKEREIKMIENLHKKKLSKDYVDKLIVLLYNSKNKLNYSQKRNNIKKAIYKLDENNELYLTLPKLKNRNKNVYANNYAKTETTEYSNNKITSNNPSPNRYLDDEEILDENIKEILYDNEDKNDIVKKEEEEEKGKILFEKLKTRYDSFDLEDNNNLRSEDNVKNKKKYKSLPKLQKKQIPSEYKLIATPQQISEFDYNLGKSFVNGKLRYLTNGQKEKLSYIAELNIFNSIDRIKEKANLIKELKNENKNKKKLLMPIDFFKYDSEKWKKISDERNKNINDIVITKLNEENKDKLNVMKEYINKLNMDAFMAEKDVNKTINNINFFLTKYGMEAGSSNSSKKSIVHQNSKRKEKRWSEAKNEKSLNLEY